MPKLTQFQKQCIAHQHKQLKISVKDLAERNEVSTRTIGRVLDEYQIARPLARAKGEAYNVMKLLEQYHLNYATLKTMLEKKSSKVA